MAIAETDPRKSDADQTSTGSSRDVLHNETKKMLSEKPGGTSQLNSISNRFYFNIKDFAFNMPGGWDDNTLSIFLDCCNKYKDDFRLPVKTSTDDDLKVWQKIVKKCSEQSDFGSAFTVNSVMELAQSLKAYVLRNENRKDDDNFKMLCNDVVDLLQYFPTESSDNVNQNLRQRSRSKSNEVNSFNNFVEMSGANRSPMPSVDSVVTECCLRYQNVMENNRSCTNYLWREISNEVEQRTGENVDAKKFLSDLKRKICKQVKKEPDPKKRHIMFFQLVGERHTFFDYIPPRTVKKIHFICEEAVNEEQDDVGLPEAADESNETAIPQVKNKRGNRFVSGKVNAESECSYSEVKITPVKVSLRRASLEKNPTFSPPSVHNTSRVLRSDVNSKLGNSKGELLYSDNSPPPPSRTRRGKAKRDYRMFTRSVNKSKNRRKAAKESMESNMTKLIDSSEDSQSPKAPEYIIQEGIQKKGNVQQRNRSEFVREPSPPRKRKKSDVQEVDENDENSSVMQGVAPKEQAYLKTHMNDRSQESVSTIKETPGNSSYINKNVNVTKHEENKEIKRNVPTAQVESVNVENRSGVASCSPPRTEVSEGIHNLNQMDKTSVKIVEEYKEKVELRKSSGASLMQLIPKSHVNNPSLDAGNSSNQEMEAAFSVSKPPVWFDTFVCDYKKHEMWKMHQLLKMQQELVDMENKKLCVLEKILGSLHDRK